MTRSEMSDERFREKAIEQYQDRMDDAIDFDDDACVSRNTDKDGSHGAYVQAWVWVDNDSLMCDGWCDDAMLRRECDRVTHVDDKGYIYCEPCSNRRRQGGYPVRQLTKTELDGLRCGEPVKEF